MLARMMMKTLNRDFLLKVGILAGIIIGAGVFSLPYVFRAAGFLTGIFYLALSAAVYIALYIMYAQVISETDGEHRFVGYARIYLGRFASFFAILISIAQAVVVLTIYLILAQSFASLITDYGKGMDALVVFWLVGSLMIFLGVRRIAWSELVITGGMIAVLLIVFFIAITSGSHAVTDDVLPGSVGAFFLPLGAVLFSLSGRQAIPEIVKIGGGYKKAIAVGVLIPVAVYFLFVVSVLALSPVVTEDAVSGLVGAVPGFLMLAIIGVFGIFSLLSSYGTIGLDVYESLGLDFKLPFWAKFLIIIFGPIALFFAGAQSFLALVGIAGGIFLAIEGILIVLIWLRMKKKKPSLGAILMVAVFATALAYEILK